MTMTTGATDDPSAAASVSAGDRGRRRRLRIGSAAHYAWLAGLVRCLLVLNLLDAVFTLFWVHLGLAREANPLLRDLVVHHPVAFVVAKLALVSLGSLLLWWRRQRPLAVIAIFAAFLCYYALLLVHLGYLGAALPSLHARW